MSHHDREERHGRERGGGGDRGRERDEGRAEPSGRGERPERESRAGRGPQRAEGRESGRGEERPAKREQRPERTGRREDAGDDGPNGFPEKRIVDMVVRLVTERVMEAMRKELDLRGLTVPPTVDVTPRTPESKENTGDSGKPSDPPKADDATGA